MFNYSPFPFKKIGFFTGAVLGMCLMAEESFAQNDRDKIEPESAKILEKPLFDEQNVQEVIIPKVLSPSKSNSNPLPIPSTPIRREVVLNPEGKKVEPLPSTLSYNIFLYVVDKFKAD